METERIVKFQMAVRKAARVLNFDIAENELLPLDDVEIIGHLHKKFGGNAGLILSQAEQFLIVDPRRMNESAIIQNVKTFYSFQPFFYDKNGLFWFWQQDQYVWKIVDETDILLSIESRLLLQGQTINAGARNQYLEAIKQVGRVNQPTEAPSRWIQFKDKAFSLRSKNVYEVKSNYFFTNSIPFALGESESTPTIDKFFTEWVG